MGKSEAVLTGASRILRDPGRFPLLFQTRRRVGLVTNASVGPGRLELQEAGVPLVRLFTPEHGLDARGEDGTPQPDGWDPSTGLPVKSLYGARPRPSPVDLRDLDLLLFHLQDVGARFYTFLWTLTHVMEACADVGLPLWILDRPNPLGGQRRVVEGPLPDADTPESLLCRWPIPVRHSLTLGELARLLQEEMALDVDLTVVSMEGWRRDMHWPATGLPFQPPSPGIPSFASALLYPGLALLEATTLGEGRGTPRAFQVVEGPGLNGERLAHALNRRSPPGVEAISRASGIRLRILEPESVRPVALGLHLLAVLRTLDPERPLWSPYPTADNPSGQHHLLRLLGSRDAVEALVDEPEGVQAPRIRNWTRIQGWWKRVESHLLYD